MVGQLPHETPEGVSVAFEALTNEFSRRGQPLLVVDWNRKGGTATPGTPNLRRALATVSGLVSVLRMAPRCFYLYMTIGATLLGFTRDAFVILIGRLFDLRVTLHLKGGGFRDFYESQNAVVRFVIRSVLSQADAIVVLGELLRDQFYFVPRITDKLHVVYNGLPRENDATALPTRGKPGHEREPLRILYLSNLIPSKGFLDLIRACQVLSEHGHEYRANFYGRFITTPDDSGPDAPCDPEAFNDLVTRLGIGASVRYRGVALGQAKWQALADADVLVLPTYYPWEGQPICIIEAFACGLPVISTRHKSIPEQVTHEVNGLLVTPKSPDQIAGAIERLISDPVLYSKLSLQARETYRQKFSFESHFNALSKVIFG